jgi:hypothetical protein
MGKWGTMKRSFVMSDDGHLKSALVCDDMPEVLGIGSRLLISRLLDLGPDAQIKEGELGTVDYIDPASGLVEVLLDRAHRGLARWDNHMWLEPFGTEDILSGIVCLCAVVSQHCNIIAIVA